MALPFLCLASGALTPIPAAVTMVIQLVVGARHRRAEWIGAGALVALSVLLTLFIPTIPHHAVLRANSIGQFLEAFSGVASWPFDASVARVLFVNAPMLAALVWLARNNCPIPRDCCDSPRPTARKSSSVMRANFTR